MLLIAAVALALGGGRWAYEVWPEVELRRWHAASHAQEVPRWVQNAAASERREVSVQRYSMDKSKNIYTKNSKYLLIMRKIYEGAGPRVFPADHYPRGYREELTAVCLERAAYHERMRRKWARAAWTPWTTVAPDPPMPPVTESGPSNGSY